MKWLKKIGILSLMALPFQIHAQNFEYSDISLDNVSFAGDTLLIRKDGLTQGYNGYNWSSSLGLTKKPTAYTSNKAPRVKAEFSWACASSPDSIYVQGLGPDDMIFPPIKVPITTSGGLKKFIYPYTFSTSVFPANQARYYESYDIDWMISFDNSHWSNVGTSESEVFVVKNAPMSETSTFKYWHSVYYLSCKNAQGLSAESEIIEALFSEFEDQQVLNHRGDTLFYYRNMATSNVNLGSLLLNHDAQCFTFAQLFLAMMKIQGIVRTNNYVNITPQNNIVCGGYAVNRFIVKNWEPTGLMTSSCASFPYLNVYVGSLFNPSYTAYNFSYTEIEDQDGAPGPGNINPSSYFNNHQIALVDGVYYDACYGIKYPSLAEYTLGAIEGWSYRVTSGSTNNCYFTTDMSMSSFTQSITTF